MLQINILILFDLIGNMINRSHGFSIPSTKLGAYVGKNRNNLVPYSCDYLIVKLGALKRMF